MRIIGCDLHARQQTLAMLDTVTGEVVTRTLMHAGNEVREFTQSFRTRCWWASKRSDRCSGFLICSSVLTCCDCPQPDSIAKSNKRG